MHAILNNRRHVSINNWSLGISTQTYNMLLHIFKFGGDQSNLSLGVALLGDNNKPPPFTVGISSSKDN